MSEFDKNILLSFAIAAGLLLVVNIVGEITIQHQTIAPAEQVKEAVAVKICKYGV